VKNKKQSICFIIVAFLLLQFSCTTPPIDEPIVEQPVTDTTQVLAYMYDIVALPEYNLEISTAEWNKFLTYFDQNPNNEEYILAACTVTKQKVEHKFATVGMRLRGNTSRRRAEGVKGEMHNPIAPDWHHASFTVKFNKYNKAQKFLGQEKIILKWFKDDALYAREVYCYDLFERFGVWTAPQSSYCKLTIKIKEDAKAAYFGVYQLVEPVDEDYLRNRTARFGDINGFLWKANYGADFNNSDKSRMGLEKITLTSTYEPVYDLKTNSSSLEAAKTQLADFIDNVRTKSGDDFKQWIQQRTDVELLLKTYAVNVMCGMWDDYWNNSNNFYFYFDTTGKFWFIPYDYDNTLGTSLLMTDAGKRDPLSWGKSSNPLIKKIISIPEFQTIYKNQLKSLGDSTQNYFNAKQSIPRIQKWHKLIQNHIVNDTEEDMSIQDVPASWGNCSFYRLLSNENNFFKTKVSYIPQ
jgi:spore coat protein CotH